MYQVGSSAVYSPASYETAAYNYPDASTNANRIVTINFDRNLLKACTVNLMYLLAQDFIFGFDRYPNLATFSVAQIGPSQAGAVLNLNWDGSTILSQLSSLTINTCFAASSRYYGTIPSFFFLMPIQQLAVGDQGMSSKTFAQSKLDQIYLLSSTLNSLTLQNIALTDNNSGAGPLPSNFSSLTNLQTLKLLSPSYTAIPSVVNSITSLTTLYCAFVSSVTSYGDISALTNLVLLGVQANYNIPTTIPSYFSGLTKLKTWDLRNCFKTQTRIDTAISNIYSFIITNAPITGTSASSFRSMIFNVDIFSVGDGTAIPSGTYQQPSGYVSGSNNGSPASSLEMIWVMVHQYAHTWTYRAS